MGILLYTLLGLLMGGLLNVLADDLPARRRPALPHCPQCGRTHRPARWLGLTRKRCPACGTRQPPRTRLVAVGTALIFALLWLHYQGLSAELLITSVYLAILALILVTDMEHRLILHVVTLPAITFALLASFFTVTPISALLGAAVGFGFFFLVYLLGGLTFGVGAMGFGDVTLATFIGTAAGFPRIIVGLLVGILAGGVITLGLLLTGRRRLRSKVPYGPFLIIGAVTALLWGEQIIRWYLQ